MQAYFKQRKQKPRENVQEFSEAFLILLDQLNPTLSEEASIAAFEDKLHKDISAALAGPGDRFDTLREAIQKSKVVEEKQMRWEVHFAFLRGIEPASRVDSFETTMSQITDGDIVATLEETGKKRGLEESIQGLQASMKSSAGTFSKLSKQFANKLQMQPENTSLNSIDPSGYSQMFFS